MSRLVSTKVYRINDVANNNEFKIKINESGPQEKLLGAVLDDQLNFKSHMSNLCKTGSEKLNAVARIPSFMDLPKHRIIMKVHINSQFHYCQLVWMMHNRSINNKINRIHEQALKIVYKDNFSTFKNLLEKVKADKVLARIL